MFPVESRNRHFFEKHWLGCKKSSLKQLDHQSVDNMRMGKYTTRSGLIQTWKLWRHCCCRYGWIPVIVAPLVTVATFLDLYATIDCDFIKVDVGFIPANAAWNQSTASIGIFQYSVYAEANLIDDLAVEGCTRFSQHFEASFVENDRTWEVTRIMAYISGISAIIASVSGFRAG